MRAQPAPSQMTIGDEDILFFTRTTPMPSGLGVAMRGYMHLQALAKVGRVTLVLANADDGDIPALAPLCANIVDLKGKAFSDCTSLWLDPERIARQSIVAFRMPVARDVDLALKRAHCRAARRVVDFDDIESRAVRRSLLPDFKAIGWAATASNILQALRLRRLETMLLKQWDDVLICSSTDQALLQRRQPRADVHVLPNTLALPEMLSPQTPSDDARLLFVGALNYPPNIDALEFFGGQLLPSIKRRLSDRVSITIVGRKPVDRATAAAQQMGAQLIANAPSLTPHYQAADIVVVPLRYGGGTRIKILEAMAFGRPVVSSRLGAEGLDVTNGEDILLADSPEDFATAIARLRADQALWQRLVNNARRLVCERYSQQAAEKAWCQILAGSTISAYPAASPWRA